MQIALLSSLIGAIGVVIAGMLTGTIQGFLTRVDKLIQESIKLVRDGVVLEEMMRSFREIQSIMGEMPKSESCSDIVLKAKAWYEYYEAGLVYMEIECWTEQYFGQF